MAADRLMNKNGDFPDYEEYYGELEQYLAKGLVEAEKQAEDFGREFAEKHRHDAMHYFIGAGNQWGAVYSYAMCYWEEQSWLRSKSIHAAEFLHGTLEIVDETTPVTLFLGEDEQRPLAERVKTCCHVFAGTIPSLIQRIIRLKVSVRKTADAYCRIY